MNDALPSGATSSAAYAINAHGEIAGVTSYGVTTWSPDGKPTVLPGLIDGGAISFAGLNDSGEVVGNQSGDALLWPKGAKIPSLLQDAPLSQFGADVVSISNAGDSVGNATVLNLYQSGVTVSEALYWNADGEVTVLSTPSDRYYAISNSASTINDAGTIIGGIRDNEAIEWSNTGSVIWQSSTAYTTIYAVNDSGASVGYDGTAGIGAYWSPTGQETLLNGVPIAINASGQSVGENLKWSSTGAYTVLGDIPGSTGAEAQSINDLGNVVGYCPSAEGDIATAWTASGKVLDLQTDLGPKWTDTVASGINDKNDIVGTGDYNGVQRAFELLWVPNAGAAHTGEYINSTNHTALAAAALHVEHASFSPHRG